MFRNTFLNVDLDKLQNNAKFFINRSGKKLIAVVKANGYGIIDYCEALALEEIGVNFFAVSSLDEAMNLRNNGVTSEILVLGFTPNDALDLIKEKDISIVTLSEEYVDAIDDFKGVKIHLKVNTGMNRIGIRPEDCQRVLEKVIKRNGNIEGIMSHFSSADEDLEYSLEQFNLFKQTVKSLDYDFKYIHMGATDATLKIEDDISTHCRIGLGLLGFSVYPCDIKPCVSLTSEVVMCKQVPKGEKVSYNRHYTSTGEGYILTIPFGYSDGFRKANVNKQVYVDHEYGTIIGNICMDMMMIHTDNYHPCKTTVELLGEHIDINKRAQELNMINYELLVNLNERITRRYFKNGKLIKQVDQRFNNSIDFQ